MLSKNPERCLVVHDTGTGKTRTACEYIKQNAADALVICPKALKENWRRELSKWGAVARVMSKEEFKKESDSLPVYRILIWDEAHHVSNSSSAMSKKFLKYIKQGERTGITPRILLLTATPMSTTPWQIHQLAKILGHNWDYLKFRGHFFKERYMGKRTIWVPKEGMDDEIARGIKLIGDVVHISECADIPEQTFETEYFELTKEQIAAKEANYDPVPIVRFTRHDQIENGVLKSDGYAAPQTFHSLKNDRIYDLCAQHDKIAIVCRYNQQIDVLWANLKALRYRVHIIRGDVKDRDAVVQEVEKSEKCVVLIQADCAEGYQLPSIGVCVFASLSFSFIKYKQLVGRFLRLDKLKKNVYIHLVADGVDNDIYETVVVKRQNFNMTLYAQNK